MNVESSPEVAPFRPGIPTPGSLLRHGVTQAVIQALLASVPDIPSAPPPSPPTRKRGKVAPPPVQATPVGQRRPVALVPALDGSRGAGLSSLARAVCADPRVRQAFPDGILWLSLDVTVGCLLERLESLLRILEAPPPAAPNLEAMGASLRQALQSKRVLLVLDDVSQPGLLTPFLEGGPGCGWLITARQSLGLPAGCLTLPVGGLTPEEALTLLGQGLLGAELSLENPASSSSLGPLYPAVSRLTARLAEWPSLLSLVAAAARVRTAAMHQSPADALEALSRRLDQRQPAALDRRQAGAFQQALPGVLELCLELLQPPDRERFFALACFPPEEPIPLDLVERLWARSGLTGPQSAGLCQYLLQLQLLAALDLQAQTLRLSPLLLETLRQVQPAAQAQAHAQLLEASLPRSGRWLDLPHRERYLQRRLCYHLAGAGRLDTVRELVTAYRWLEQRLERHGLAAVLDDCARLDPADPAAVVGEALQRAAAALAVDPSQLPGQLVGRLMASEEALVRPLVQQARAARNAPWLRPLVPSLLPPGGALVAQVRGHAGGVTGLILLEGPRALTCGPDGWLCMWDTGSLRRLGAWLVGASPTAMTPLEGGLVALGRQDGLLEVWDAVHGVCTLRLEAHAGGVSALASLGGGKLASAGRDLQLKLWQVSTGECLRACDGGDEVILGLAAMRDGKLLTCAEREAIHLWNAPRGELLAVLEGHTDQVVEVVSLERGRVLSLARDGGVKLWDPGKSQPIHGFEAGRAEASRVAALGGGRVVVGFDDGALRVYDKDGGCLRVLNGHGARVVAVLALEGSRFLSAGADGELRLWDLGRPQRLQLFEGHVGPVQAVTALESGPVVSGGADGAIRVWDFARARCLQVLSGHEGAVTALVALPGGLAVSASRDATLRVWEVAQGRALSVLTGHHFEVLCLAARGSEVFSGSRHGALCRWDPQGPGLVAMRRLQDSHLTAMTFVDGYLIVGGSDGSLRLWDADRLRCLGELEPHRAAVTSLAAMPGGRLLSAGQDGEVRLYLPARGPRPALVLEQGGGGRLAGWPWPTLVAPLEEARVLVLGTDHRARVWDLATSQVAAVFTADGPLLAGTALPFDTLAVGDHYGRLHFLRLEAFQLLEQEEKTTARQTSAVPVAVLRFEEAERPRPNLAALAQGLEAAAAHPFMPDPVEEPSRQPRATEPPRFFDPLSMAPSSPPVPGEMRSPRLAEGAPPAANPAPFSPFSPSAVPPATAPASAVPPSAAPVLPPSAPRPGGSRGLAAPPPVVNTSYFAIPTGPDPAGGTPSGDAAPADGGIAGRLPSNTPSQQAIPAQLAPLHPLPPRPTTAQPAPLQPLQGSPPPAAPQPGAPQPGAPQPGFAQPGAPLPGAPLPGAPRVFVVYSPDSPEHVARVRALVDRLARDGVLCVFDRYVRTPADGWPAWMDRELKAAQHILAVWTPTLRQAVQGEGPAGAAWPGRLLAAQLLPQGRPDARVQSILLEGLAAEDCPDVFRSGVWWLEVPGVYELLLRRLLDPELADELTVTMPQRR